MSFYVYRYKNLNGIKILENYVRTNILKVTQITSYECKNEELYNTYYKLESAISDFFCCFKKGYKILCVCYSKITPCYYIISCFPIPEFFENQIIIPTHNLDKDIDYYQTRYQQQLHFSTSSSEMYNLDEKYKKEDKPSYSNRDVFDAIDII